MMMMMMAQRQHNETQWRCFLIDSSFSQENALDRVQHELEHFIG